MWVFQASAWYNPESTYCWGKDHCTAGPNPINILQCKFYARQFFQAFWLASQIFQPIRMHIIYAAKSSKDRLLVSIFTRLDLNNKENMLLFVHREAVESKLLKLEPNNLVILSQHLALSVHCGSQNKIFKPDYKCLQWEFVALSSWTIQPSLAHAIGSVDCILNYLVLCKAVLWKSSIILSLMS